MFTLKFTKSAASKGEESPDNTGRCTVESTGAREGSDSVTETIPPGFFLGKGENVR